MTCPIQVESVCKITRADKYEHAQLISLRVCLNLSSTFIVSLLSGTLSFQVSTELSTAEWRQMKKLRDRAGGVFSDLRSHSVRLSRFKQSPVCSDSSWTSSTIISSTPRPREENDNLGLVQTFLNLYRIAKAGCVFFGGKYLQDQVALMQTLYFHFYLKK